MSIEEKKKLMDRVEKQKKKCEITKAKYKKSLDDLNAYNSRYIEDMNVVSKKCDSFEIERIEFFKQTLTKFQCHLNIYEEINVEDIYADFYRTLKHSNPVKELVGWSNEFGAGMAMNWPKFEEYSEAKRRVSNHIKAKKCVAKTLFKRKRDDMIESANCLSNSNLSKSPVDLQYR
jgi:protein kinase C and casein kinase substrate in neurons protein